MIMSPIGVFYGSTTGNTEAIAVMIQELLGLENVRLHDVKDVTGSLLSKYQNVIVGASTWGFGSIQRDWKRFLDELEQVELTNTTVAIFGLGD
jgi:flavodoxin I